MILLVINHTRLRQNLTVLFNCLPGIRNAHPTGLASLHANNTITIPNSKTYEDFVLSVCMRLPDCHNPLDDISICFHDLAKPFLNPGPLDGIWIGPKQRDANRVRMRILYLLLYFRENVWLFMAVCARMRQASSFEDPAPTFSFYRYVFKR